MARRPGRRLVHLVEAVGRRESWLLVVAVVALAIRALYVALVLRDYAPLADAHHYHTMAAHIGEGEGVSHSYPFDFVHPTAWRPPMYPLLLGAVYAVTGPKLGAAQVLNVVLGTAVAVLAALLARRLAGRVAGTLAGLLVAIHPSLVFNDGPPLSEPLGLLLLLVTILLLTEQRTALAGATTGLLALTRPSGQFVALALAAWILWRLGPRRALSYAACIVLVVSPWMIRNWVRLGSPVLVTSNGFNLNAMYSPEAREFGGFVDAVFNPRLAEVRAGFRDEVQFDAALRRRAIEAIADDPGYVVYVVRRNVGSMFELQPNRNRVAETVDGRNLDIRMVSLPMVWLVLGAGLAGMWVLRRDAAIGPLVLSGRVFCAVSLVSITAPRLRAPLDVICCVTAAVALTRVVLRRGDAPGGLGALQVPVRLRPPRPRRRLPHT